MSGNNGVQICHRLETINPNSRSLLLSALYIAQESIDVHPQKQTRYIVKIPAAGYEGFLHKVQFNKE
jgi:hypothetical protein